MDNFRDSYFQVDWDLTSRRLRGTFWGKQYDTGRGFAVTVINGGQVVTATNEVLRLKWEKPDKTTGYVNATIVDGKFIVENIDQMFTVQGSVRADFELSVAGESLASITFRVSVEKAVAVDAIESSSDFTALQDALAQVSSIETQVAEVQSQFNQAVGAVTVDSEVVLARNEHATLKERLDSDNAELAQHKLDYDEQRRQDQLKVAKVEKDINDYKSTMANVNVNQEAKQTASGYGTISLPKNSANGQVGVSVKANTLTNFIANGDFANGVELWVNAAGSTLSSSNNELIMTTSGQSSQVLVRRDNGYNANGGKVFIKMKVKADHLCSYIQLRLYGQTSGVAYGSGTGKIDSPIVGQWYTLHYIFDTSALVGGARVVICTRYDTAEAGKVVRATGIAGLDINTHSQLQGKTSAEINSIVPNYFDGTKSTQSASRLKSVGKNLFDGELEYGTILVDTGENSGSGSSITVRTKNFIDIEPNINYSVTNIDRWYLYDENKNFISTGTAPTLLAPNNARYLRGIKDNGDLSTVMQIEKGTVATPYEPYTESTQYLPNVGELRSVPSAKDEISLTDGVKKQGVGNVVLNGLEPWQALNSDVNTYNSRVDNWATANNALVDGNNSAFGYCSDGNFAYDPTTSDTRHLRIMSANQRLQLYIEKAKIDTQTGATLLDKWTAYLNQYPVTLNYQLAEPIITPIEVSGTLLSNPSGTVYVENVVADAGIYGDKLNVLHIDLPIKEIEKVSKVDFTTGVETELDVSQCVVSEDKLSFTHTDLTNGDIVFFTYYYDLESTRGETTIEYYDSRHTLKDDVTGKFYKVVPKISDGVLTNELVEV